MMFNLAHVKKTHKLKLCEFTTSHKKRFSQKFDYVLGWQDSEKNQ